MMKLTTSSPIRHSLRAAFLTIALSAPALCQTTVPLIPEPISLSGPRFGTTFLSPGIVETIKEKRVDVGSFVTQFGWQFENRFRTGEHGLMALNEWVVLVGGLEQGVALPSVSWMVGIRTGTGIEFGVGPNVTPAGVALAAAAGVTFRSGALNVPVNLAIVPSKSGVRVSVLTGFNMRRQ
jgi:hypothetical protein